MYVKRNLSLPFMLRYTWLSLVWTTLYSAATLTVFFHLSIKWIDVPFELVTAVGVAVAFFIGFKNNQAYERFWEGRKIWGGIVNYSRVWTIQVLSLIACRDERGPVSEEFIRGQQRILIYRHLAWVNALRVQLRKPTNFAATDNVLVEHLVTAHHDGAQVADVIAPFVSEEEGRDLALRENVATHLVKAQSEHLRVLRKKSLMDGFDHIIMMGTLEKVYDLQGMCERIKNTPFPRQFAHFSQIFTIIFCVLLPLGLLDVYEKELVAGVVFADTFKIPYMPTVATIYAMVPLSVLVSWIFLTWEKIGDSSEDPFEGRPHDVSMTALCRTIEIDLRDMLDETDLPPKVGAKDNILY